MTLEEKFNQAQAELDAAVKEDAAKERLMEIPIARIHRDPYLQSRVAIKEERIDKYAELTEHEPGKLPPARAYYNPELDAYYIWDGYTRLEARRRLSTLFNQTIPGLVKIGTLEDAIEAAAGANEEHGEGRTNDDQVKAIRNLLLGVPKWRNRSDREIAKVCHLSSTSGHKQVGRIYAKMVEGKEIPPRPAEREGGDGKTRKPPTATGSLTQLPEQPSLSISTPEQRTGPGLFDQTDPKAAPETGSPAASRDTPETSTPSELSSNDTKPSEEDEPKALVAWGLKAIERIKATTTEKELEDIRTKLLTSKHHGSGIFVNQIHEEANAHKEKLRKGAPEYIDFVSGEAAKKKSSVTESVESSLQKTGELDAKTLLPKRSPAEKQAYREQQDTNREAKHAAIAGEARSLASPDKLGPFTVLYVDCPWQYSAQISEAKTIEQQYPTLSVEELCKLNISMITARQAVLYLWATAPLIKEALQVIDAWGFQYKTHYVWIKGRNGSGLGHWVRVDHELLFIATKGGFPTPLTDDRISSVLDFPKGSHSEKPKEVRDHIAELYPDQPKVELFAREKAEGWVSIGNEIDGRDIRDVLNPNAKQLGLPRVATPEAKPALPKEEEKSYMLHAILRSLGAEYQRQGYTVSVATPRSEKRKSISGACGSLVDVEAYQRSELRDEQDDAWSMEITAFDTGRSICTLHAFKEASNEEEKEEEEEFPSPWMSHSKADIRRTTTQEECIKVALPLIERATTDAELAELKEVFEAHKNSLPHAENVRSPRQSNELTTKQRALKEFQKCDYIAEGKDKLTHLLFHAKTKVEAEQINEAYGDWKKTRPATKPYNAKPKAPKPTRNQGKNEEKKTPKKSKPIKSPLRKAKAKR